MSYDLRQWLDEAQDRVNDLSEILASLVDANATGLLHRKSGIWKDAEKALGRR